jgi:hypothetical protein
MARELGGSQISALLESVPGIANVLRSPVADALMGMIRAGAGVGEFKIEQAQELVQYAVRRGLIQSGEGDEVLAEAQAAASQRRSAQRAAKKAEKQAAKLAAPNRKAATKAGAKSPVPKASRVATPRKLAGAAKQTAKLVKKPAGRPAKKAAKTTKRR